MLTPLRARRGAGEQAGGHLPTLLKWRLAYLGLSSSTVEIKAEPAPVSARHFNQLNAVGGHRRSRLTYKEQRAQMDDRDGAFSWPSGFSFGKRQELQGIGGNTQRQAVSKDMLVLEPFLLSSARLALSVCTSQDFLI